MIVAAILIVFLAGVLVGRRAGFERGYANAEEVAHGRLMDRLISGELLLGSLAGKRMARPVVAVIVKGVKSPLCRPVVIGSIKRTNSGGGR